MKFFRKGHRFTNFMLFALAAIAINVISSYSGGYYTSYTITVYKVGSLLLVAFIILHKLGYEFLAKLLSTLFFNAFFFIFSEYYGLRAQVFIYYFPFLVSYIFLYKNDATKAEARIFTSTCLAFILLTFLWCSMNGHGVLTTRQETLMFKKNFIVAFALSAYYFNAIFSYLTLQMKLAQEASTSKARFLSIMSHELRTPLNGIISSINLMETAKDEREKNKFSYVLKTSSEHMLHLVNNVLDYSKAAAGKMELNLVNCSMHNLLWKLQAVFQSRFDEKQLKLEVFIDEEIKQTVMMDDVRFVQVLTNFLSNALKFTDRGKVMIKATCVSINNAHMQVEVSVTDTGEGISQEQQKLIFDSFNNVEKGARKVESSGLGLSISKMIVERMSGNISLESEVNAGSKFFFTITVPIAQVQEKPVVIQEDINPSLSGVKILIAEDNPINMMVARAFLKRWDVITLEAVNGVEARNMLLQHPEIDLLLLDLQMPEMNGYEVMTWIKEAGLKTPVLAFTAQIMLGREKKDLIDLGFTEMIPKPFAPEELQQKIKNALTHIRRDVLV